MKFELIKASCCAWSPVLQTSFCLLQWAETQKQCNRLKLHDLLVKPMQRLTRYGLLLRAIAKKTDEPDVKEDLREMVSHIDSTYPCFGDVTDLVIGIET